LSSSAARSSSVHTSKSSKSLRYTDHNRRTPSSPRYSPEQIERGLFALAICGKAAEAARQLAATEQKIPKATLQTWKTKHAGRFREITDQHVKQIREVIAQEQIEIAHAAGDGCEHPVLGR